MNKLLFLLILPLFLACEKADFTKPADNAGDMSNPIGVGAGTKERPYTVSQFRGSDVVGACWVIGYVVGSTYSSWNNAVFAAQTTFSNNVILSDDSDCDSADGCIAISLPSKLQPSFSLADNPERYRSLVMFYGTKGQYLSRTGMLGVTQGAWVSPNFSLDFSTDPQPWE